jgi:hypothetical protein
LKYEQEVEDERLSKVFQFLLHPTWQIGFLALSAPGMLFPPATGLHTAGL